MADRNWEVEVRFDGECILTIGSDLSGLAELTEAQENAIREAGRHLLAFIGNGEPVACFICQGAEDGCPICDPKEWPTNAVEYRQWLKDRDRT